MFSIEVFRRFSVEVSRYTDEDHEHGCGFELVPLEQADLTHALASSVDFAVLRSSPVLARSLAPRGPPLAYAPKTGPPIPR